LSLDSRVCKFGWVGGCSKKMDYGTLIFL